MQTQSMLPLQPRSSYALPSEFAEELVRDLLDEYPARTSQRFACYRIAGTQRYSDLGRTLECEVFQEFFGNDPQEMSAAYGAYEQGSSFFLAVDQRALRAVGVLRVVMNTAAHGLKTFDDLAAAPLCISADSVAAVHGIASLEACWDVGTLAVTKDYRSEGHWVSTLLYGSCHKEAVRDSVEHLVAILDPHAYRQLTEQLGVPFVPLADTPPFDYLGAKGSQAAYLHVPGCAPAISRHMDSLDEQLRPLLGPLLARVARAEGLPELVRIP